MVYYLNLLGTAIFAVGGALAAARKGMDLFGVVVAAVLTAMGADSPGPLPRRESGQLGN